MVSDGGQVLADGVAGADVVRLTQDGRPTVLEEVPGGLTVEVEHSKDVGRGHAVTEELDTEARVGLLDLRGGLGGIRDSHDSVLDTLEHTSVGLVGMRDDLNLGVDADGVSLLDSVNGHGVGDDIVGEVHVLVKQTGELEASIEALTSGVLEGLLPDEFLLADGAEGLVLGSIEHLSVLGVNTACIGVLTSIEIGLVVTPIVLPTISAVRDYLGLLSDKILRRRLTAGLLDVASDRLAVELGLRLISTVLEQVLLVGGELRFSSRLGGSLSGSLRSVTSANEQSGSKGTRESHDDFKSYSGVNRTLYLTENL